MSSLTLESAPQIEADAYLAKKYPEYANLVGNINAGNTDLARWDKLFNYLDHLIDIDKSDQIKSAVNAHYTILLSIFPYLVDYWKNFITIEYQLQGLNKSVKVIQRSVELFPNSIELWLDYLNIIISNRLDNGNDEFVRGLFVKSLDNCGRQFLSHPLWDQYLEWEAGKSGEVSTAYVSILLRVIELPLHQYAKYSTKFLELKNDFPLSELIPLSELEVLLKGKNLEALSIEEQTEISDDYFAKVIHRTSERTNERWNYEQNIHTTHFQLAPVPQEELVNWEAYLKFEESQRDESQITSLYERCLVPCAMYEKFWIMYLKYLIRSENQSQQEIKQVFEKGLRFVPVELKNLRLMYARYLIELSEDEKAVNLLLPLLTDLASEAKALQILYLILAKETTFIEDVDTFLTYSFGDYSDEEEQANKKRKTNVVIIKEFDEVRDKLMPLLRGEIFKQVVSNVTNFHQLSSVLLNYKIADINEVKQKRETFLQFINKNSISRDTQFWVSFIAFEIQQRNSKNLTNILNYILNYSQLPQDIQHHFIKQIIKFLLKNTDPSTSPLELSKILLEIDDNASFNYKKFSKSKNQISDQFLLRQAGHPGIDTEAKPFVVNRLNFFETLDSVPALPIYKNVEKASVAIKYPKPDDEAT